MAAPATFTAAPGDSSRQVTLGGDWTAAAMADAGERLKRSLRGAREVRVDMNGVGRCDTAGALAIITAPETPLDLSHLTAPPAITRLMALVAGAGIADEAAPPPRPRRENALQTIGRSVVGVAVEGWAGLIFLGHLAVAIGRVIRQPGRMRWAACFTQVQRAGLDAIPIIAVTTFFIGAVVGLLGENELRQFGAQIFVVQLIGIAVLREFNIIITAILLAGRSASSFAAEIGAMKMNQEIDAMRVMGVDPFDALVLPRFLALFVTIPVLTFVATVAGLVGGMIVCWVTIGLGPQFFLRRIAQTIPVANLWVGLSKGPIMALVVAAIGCRQGLEVGGDVESLGQHVTLAVVQAIFSIIVIDAVVAMIYMRLGV
jgi:phospholipid/cholesterol/gamma-HCH transport system permease protein